MKLYIKNMVCGQMALTSEKWALYSFYSIGEVEIATDLDDSKEIKELEFNWF
jgi:hypothetical protein